MTQKQFARMLGSGALVWCWETHGFHYGIAAHYAAEVAAGRTVVINGSREHAGGLDAAKQLRVVQIMANVEQLAARLVQRGRDTPQEVTSDWRAMCSSRTCVLTTSLLTRANWLMPVANWQITWWQRSRRRKAVIDVELPTALGQIELSGLGM